MNSNITEASRALSGAPRGSRKNEILDAAAGLFRERGYHGTTLNDISSAIGLTGPAIYRHFSHKDDVLASAVWDMAREIRDAVEPIFSTVETTPRDCIESGLRAFAYIILLRPDYAATYHFEARYLRSEVFAKMRRSDEAFRQHFVDALLRIRPELSRTRARIMIGSVVNMLIGATLQDREIDRGRLHGILIEMAIRALFDTLPLQPREARDVRPSEALPDHRDR